MIILLIITILLEVFIFIEYYKPKEIPTIRYEHYFIDDDGIIVYYKPINIIV